MTDPTTGAMSGPSIPALLDHAVERFGDRPAIVDGETAMNYRELQGAAHEFAAALAASGVEPGDRVAIWAFNSVQWVVSALGLFAAGAVLVPINTRFKGVEAGSILVRSRARVLVTVTDFLGTDYVDMLQAGGVATPDLEAI